MVVDPKLGPEFPATLLGVLPNAIAGELELSGAFRTFSAQDMREMLGVEEKRQLLNCADTSCLVEIGAALGSDFVLSTQINKLGETTQVQMQMLRNAKSRVEGRVSREHQGDDASLVKVVRAATREMIGRVMGGESGKLAVNVREEGATIKIEERIVGVSPLTAPIELVPGSHPVIVEKEGFVVYRQDVTMPPKGELKLDVVLVPSQEFIAAYRQRALATRAGAWAGLLVGALAVAGGTSTYVIAGSRYDELQRDYARYSDFSTGTPQDHSATMKAGLEARTRSLATLDALSIALWSVGALGLGTGGALFVIGPDPRRYDAPAVAGSGGDLRGSLTLTGAF